MFCQYCGYEWSPRVVNPKRCPKCQKWLSPATSDGATTSKVTSRYEMRFIPYDAMGNLKKSAPKVGEGQGPEDGEVWLLPLETRHEAWWELVNEDDVPPDELEKDTKKRERFMVKAMAAEAERQKLLRPVRVPIK